MTKSNAYRNLRYDILKKKFPDYLIILEKSKTKLGMRTYSTDRLVLDYITKKVGYDKEKIIQFLDKNKISYIIVDTLNEIQLHNAKSSLEYRRLHNYVIINYLLDKLLIPKG